MWTSCVAVVAAMIMRICDQRAGNAAFLRKWNHLERNYSIIWKKIKNTFTARHDRDDWMPPANRTKYDLVRWSRFGVYKYSRDVCVCCDRSIYSKHHKHHFTVNILPETIQRKCNPFYIYLTHLCVVQEQQHELLIGEINDRGSDVSPVHSADAKELSQRADDAYIITSISHLTFAAANFLQIPLCFC